MTNESALLPHFCQRTGGLPTQHDTPEPPCRVSTVHQILTRQHPISAHWPHWLLHTLAPSLTSSVTHISCTFSHTLPPPSWPHLQQCRHDPLIQERMPRLTAPVSHLHMPHAPEPSFSTLGTGWDVSVSLQMGDVQRPRYTHRWMCLFTSHVVTEQQTAGACPVRAFELRI